jgi:AraC-like DNA-binding protein
MAQLYLTHIGYFPRAAYHYRERRNGCADNILLYCLRGKGWYIIQDRRFQVKANEYVIIPATRQYLRYGADDNDPWTISWVHFSGQDMDMFNRSFKITPFGGPEAIHYNDKGLEIWETMYKTLEKGFSKENLAYTNLCLYNYIATFLYPEKFVNVKKQDTRDLIEDSINYMRSQLHTIVSVNDMANRLKISVSHFTSLFRKATGMSPFDYYIHLKLQKACLLLYSSDIKVKEVAASLGYEDPYYFSRLFKKYMNLSPDQYRVLRKTTN